MKHHLNMIRHKSKGKLYTQIKYPSWMRILFWMGKSRKSKCSKQMKDWLGITYYSAYIITRKLYHNGFIVFDYQDGRNMYFTLSLKGEDFVEVMNRK